MRKTKWKLAGQVVVAGALAATLTACGLTKKESAPPPLINGKWNSTDNTYTATFNNGSFLSRANDTGGVIAQGNYVLVDDNRVQIRWRGNVSGVDNSANCTKNGNDRLDCTDKNGKTFSLSRASVS